MGVVYAIRNRITGDEYIGSSRNLAVREKKHWGDLRRGVHHAVNLQKAFDIHGADAFDVVVLENVADDLFLRPREMFWLWRCHPAYNTILSVDPPRLPLGTRLTLSTRAKMSAAQAARWQDPDKRAALLSGMNAPDLRARRGAATRASWADPESAAVRRAAINRPDVLEKIAEASSRAWSCPQRRSEQAARVAAHMQVPGVRENLSAHGKAQWADPEKRREMLEKKRSREVLKKQADLTKAHWADPEITARRVAAMNTPEAKKKKSDALKAAWARRKASNV